jgi:hypothetical protein
MSKLTEAQVLEIFKSQKPQRILARDFDVSQRAVSKIKTGKTWRWLTNQGDHHA